MRISVYHCRYILSNNLNTVPMSCVQFLNQAATEEFRCGLVYSYVIKNTSKDDDILPSPFHGLQKRTNVDSPLHIFRTPPRAWRQSVPFAAFDQKNPMTYTPPEPAATNTENKRRLQTAHHCPAVLLSKVRHFPDNTPYVRESPQYLLRTVPLVPPAEKCRKLSYVCTPVGVPKAGAMRFA